MRRLALLLVVSLGLAATADAQAPRDWRRTASVLPSGAFAIGNPNARVKLAEWLSYTCSHCAHFATESAPELKDRLVRDGQVRLELRPIPRNRLDFAAALLMRCDGAARALGTHMAILTGQPALIEKTIAFEGGADPYAGVPDIGDQLVRVTQRSGLSALMTARGMAPAAQRTCLKDRSRDASIEALAGSAVGITGTPSFEIDGTLVQANQWSDLKPLLATAGAR